MVWVKYDDKHRQRPCGSASPTRRDGTTTASWRSAAGWSSGRARCASPHPHRASDVPNPEDCLKELVAAGLVETFTEGDVGMIRVVEVIDHIPDDALRKRRERGSRLRSGCASIGLSGALPGCMTHAKDLADLSVAEHRDTIGLYVGDFDPSGLDIDRALAERLPYRLRRIALTAEQVESYGLPPAPAKDGDSRTPSMAAAYGEAVQVELDALPPAALLDLLRAAIVEETGADLDAGGGLIDAEADRGPRPRAGRVHPVGGEPSGDAVVTVGRTSVTPSAPLEVGGVRFDRARGASPEHETGQDEARLGPWPDL